MRTVRLALVPLAGLLIAAAAGVAAAAPSLALAPGTPGAAGTSGPAPTGRPRPTPYPKAAVCVDQAAALGAGTCTRITAVLRADEAASGDEIAVAVVRTTGGVPIETWGTGLFNAWGVGKRDRNNGVLLLLAVGDHRLRIVTGRGLAGRLPDGTASEIIGATVTPLLSAGRTGDAVLAGLDAIRRALGHQVTDSTALAGDGAASADEVPPQVELPDPAPEPTPPGSNWLLLLGFLGIVGIVVTSVYSRVMRSRRGAQYADLPDAERPWWARDRRSGWATRGALWSSSEHGSGQHGSGGSGGSHHSGGSGSSGGDLGGGSSGGGGASGGW